MSGRSGGIGIWKRTGGIGGDGVTMMMMITIGINMARPGGIGAAHQMRRIGRGGEDIVMIAQRGKVIEGEATGIIVSGRNIEIGIGIEIRIEDIKMVEGIGTTMIQDR